MAGIARILNSPALLKSAAGVLKLLRDDLDLLERHIKR
ncbi:TetR family transcriptional regulator [Pandoraea anapnoica]|uniref:TetR family transcriptional regulator n=1 Tax=Pandoraea anapnoica TaxID=2508301 RepID=A0A5E5AF28_9BURK|nr:TetR family transcriptional regulator [Pandoraea anapnoica]